MYFGGIWSSWGVKPWRKEGCCWWLTFLNLRRSHLEKVRLLGDHSKTKNQRVFFDSWIPLRFSERQSMTAIRPSTSLTLTMAFREVGHHWVHWNYFLVLGVLKNRMTPNFLKVSKTWSCFCFVLKGTTHQIEYRLIQFENYGLFLTVWKGQCVLMFFIACRQTLRLYGAQSKIRG